MRKALLGRAMNLEECSQTPHAAYTCLHCLQQGDDCETQEIRIKRREALQSASLGLAALLVPPPQGALAVSLADVTPEVAPAGKLSPR